MIKIGEVVLPNPAKMTWSEFDLSSEASGRNLEGAMLKDLVARKVKIELEWGLLTPAQATKVLTNVKTALYMQVTYPDPLTGAPTVKTMYAGDRNGELRLYTDDSGAEYWDGIKANFIEK